ncbi:MAG: cupin domain-containing protein [Woeseia sp.]
MKFLTLCAALLFVATTFASDSEDGFIRLTPDELVWQDLRPGLSFSVIEGDPGKEGFYIIRAKFAPGTLSKPHYHPNDRFITVISGTWWTGIGPVQKLDTAVPLEPGSYMKHPAGAAHYDGAVDEEVIVEIKGMGPAPLIYVDSDGNPIDE